jgi:hypothetical protein
MIQDFKKAQEEMYISTVSADRLVFGIIRCSAELRLRHLTLGTQAEVVAARNIIEEMGKSAAALRGLDSKNPGYHLRTADIVAMTMKMARFDIQCLRKSQHRAKTCLDLQQASSVAEPFESA